MIAFLRRFLPPLAGALLALALPSLGATQTDPKAVRAALARRYRTIYGCYKAKDNRPMYAILAPGYVSRLRSGKVRTRAATLKLQKQIIATIVRCPVAEVRIDSLKVNGDRAVVVVTDHVVMDYRQGGRIRHWDDGATTRDTWKRVNGQWLLTMTEELPLKRRR